MGGMRRWDGMGWDGMGRAGHLVSSQVPLQSTTAAVSASSNSMKALTKLLVSVSCVCVSYAITDGRSRLVGVDGCSLYTRMVLTCDVLHHADMPAFHDVFRCCARRGLVWVLFVNGSPCARWLWSMRRW